MGQGFAVFAGIAPEIIRASAREAEALGYSSFWVNHPGATDGLVALAAAAKETRRIELGIGVIPLHTRGPDSIVQGVRANALPLDRLLLGVGSPNPDALKRVRAGIAELRSELQVRLVVAALGPQMCRLAGEIADGVLLNWIPPEAVPQSLRQIEIGAKRAGRNVADLEIAAFIRTLVTDDPAPARAWLARDITGYVIVGPYARFFAGCGFGAEVEAVNDAWKAGDRAGAVRQISERFLDGLGVVGPAEFCRQRLAEFAKAGLTQPVVIPFSADSDPKPTVARTLQAVAA